MLSGVDFRAGTRNTAKDDEQIALRLGSASCLSLFTWGGSLN